MIFHKLFSLKPMFKTVSVFERHLTHDEYGEFATTDPSKPTLCDKPKGFLARFSSEDVQIIRYSLFSNTFFETTPEAREQLLVNLKNMSEDKDSPFTVQLYSILTTQKESSAAKPAYRHLHQLSQEEAGEFLSFLNSSKTQITL